MKGLNLGFLLLLNFGILNAQNLSIQWSNSFGGYQDESPGCIIKDIFGSGFYILGSEESVDGDVSSHIGSVASSNLWLIKTDSAGNKIWEKSFGGTAIDNGVELFQLIDGGFILTGTTNSIDGDVVGVHTWPIPLIGSQDYWIVKIDSSLNIQWQRCLGGSDYDNFEDAIMTSDGGYMLFGAISSSDGDVSGFLGGVDYWAVKLDSVGNIQWQKCLGSAVNDEGRTCVELPDSTYLLAGESESYFAGYHGGGDVGIIRVSNTGSIISQRSYGGSNQDQPSKIVSTNDGGFYLIGTTTSNDGDVSGFMYYNDIWIFKADINGDIIWQKCFGGYAFDVSYDAKLTLDGGLLFSGYSVSNDSLFVIGTHGGNDIWVAKIDSIGDLQWGKSLGGSFNDVGTSILQLDANNFIVAAETQSSDDDIVFNHGSKDIWIAKLIDNGVSIYENEIGKNDLNTTFNNGILTVSFFETNSQSLDFIVFDILGKVKFRKQINSQVGLNQFAFQLESWEGLKVISLGSYKSIIY